MAFSIGERIDKKAPHHDSIEALWETKWKRPVSWLSNLEKRMRIESMLSERGKVLDRGVSVLRWEN